MSLLFFLKPHYGIRHVFDEQDLPPIEEDKKKKKRKKKVDPRRLSRQEEEDIAFLKWIMESDE